MAVLTLSEIKHQLRLEEDDQNQDALLERLGDAAQDYAEQYLGRPIPWTNDLGEPEPVPASVRSAMLLIVTDLYYNRSAQIVGSTIAQNPAAENMLHFYRVGMGV